MTFGSNVKTSLTATLESRGNGRKITFRYPKCFQIRAQRLDARRIVRCSKIEEPTVVGEWLSLVEHLVRDQGVGGSNPLSPTILSHNLRNDRFRLRATLCRCLCRNRLICLAGVNPQSETVFRDTRAI